MVSFEILGQFLDYQDKGGYGICQVEVKSDKFDPATRKYARATVVYDLYVKGKPYQGFEKNVQYKGMGMAFKVEAVPKDGKVFLSLTGNPQFPFPYKPKDNTQSAGGGEDLSVPMDNIPF